jgi:saccharopine dehydrogenase-like NADP-dependent oxidoreductase
MSTRSILILGSGKVAAPIVTYFLRKKHKVTVASEYRFQGEYLIQNHPLGEAIEWHAGDQERLNSLVHQHSIVVSLLPFHLHLDVCKACIKERRHLITSSYQQPGMEGLHSDAYKSDITILNEVGLDPGIDHMWAMQRIHTIKSKGGKIEKFISLCGALPAPEFLDNPFKYKFSWSPQAVMKACTSEAAYLKNGKVIIPEASKLMQDTFTIKVNNTGCFEAYANRNSLQYISLYDIPEAQTFFRGTLRYKGWCEAISTLIHLGYFSENPIPAQIKTYAQLTAYLANTKQSPTLKDKVANILNLDTESNNILAMEWLGLFSTIHFSPQLNTPLDILTNRMAEKMKMLPSDKDMIILHHQILYSLPDQSLHLKKGKLIFTGKDNEHTAIADSVSYTAALATELLLEEKVPYKGIIRPLYPEIYTPILKQLTDILNLKFYEEEYQTNKWPEEW